MKNVIIQLCSIIALFFLYSFSSSAIIFECENGYSFKINKNTNHSTFYFKKNDSNWRSTKKAKEINNKIEYFLPNSTYLACSNKELNVCKYKTLITYNLATQIANVREIIIADCYIGTMGCNKYEKGLELNLRRCQIKNAIATSGLKNIFKTFQFNK